MEAETGAFPLAALHLYLYNLLPMDTLRFCGHKWRHLSLQIDTPACPSPSATHFGWSTSNLFCAWCYHLMVLSFTFAALSSCMTSTSA